MEGMLSVVCYGVLLALTLGAAAVPALLVGAWRRRPFSGKIFLATMGLMAGYAAWIWGHPWVICPENLERPVTQEEWEALIQYYGGFYSPRLPLLAHCITVQGCDSQGLSATVHYLWFGSIGVSLDREGLPSIDRPLN